MTEAYYPAHASDEPDVLDALMTDTEQTEAYARLDARLRAIRDEDDRDALLCEAFADWTPP